MPNHTFLCPKGHQFETDAPWDTDFLPCKVKRCKQTAERVYNWSANSTASIQPVIVHINGKGDVRFPGASDAKPPKGFEKVELKTLREMESFERTMNAKLRGEAERHQERESVAFAQAREARRSELRQKMAGMSNYGKEFARVVMKAMDERPRKSTDPGFHIEVLNFDQSNRTEYRDERTGWKTRRA